MEQTDEPYKMDFWRMLLGLGIPKTYVLGNILYLQDTLCEGLICIIKGKVKNCRILPDGSETILTLYQGKTIIGESAALNNWPHFTSAIALTDVEAVRVPSDRVRKTILRYPELAFYLIESIGKKLRASAMQTADLAGKYIPSALAELLLSLENYGIEGSGKDRWFQITHDELAKIIGTTRPNVTTILNDLAHKKFIVLGRGRLRILNHAGLSEFADDET